MTSASILHNAVTCLDVLPPPPVSALRECLFGCGRMPKRGSVFCNPCAAAWWDELRIIGRSKEPIPDLATLRSRVLAQREQRIALRQRHAQAQLAPTAVLPTRLLTDNRLSGSPVPIRVYGALAAMGADRRAVAYSTRTIAVGLGYGVPTVRRAIRLLIDRRYLAVTHDYGQTLIRCLPEEKGV